MKKLTSFELKKTQKESTLNPELHLICYLLQFLVMSSLLENHIDPQIAESLAKQKILHVDEFLKADIDKIVSATRLGPQVSHMIRLVSGPLRSRAAFVCLFHATTLFGVLLFEI